MIQEQTTEPSPHLDEPIEFPDRWKLTERQKKIIPFLAGGLKSKHIAKILGTNDEAIYKDLRRIYDQTKSTNRCEIAVWFAGNFPKNTMEILREHNPEIYDFIVNEKSAPILLTQLEMDVLRSNAAGSECSDIEEDLKIPERDIRYSIQLIRNNILGKPNRTAMAVMYRLAPDRFVVQERPRGRWPKTQVSCGVLATVQL